MSRKLWKRRMYIVIAIIACLMVALLVRLFVLTVPQNAKWSEAADTNSEKKIYTPAARGQILDRYGRVLAGNKNVFSVRMKTGRMNNSELNDTIVNLLALFKKNGDDYYDNLPIKVTKSGKYYFTYDRSRTKWLKSENIPQNYSARKAFNYLRRKYNISESKTDAEAQIELQNTYNKYPEISVLKMQYSADLDKDAFLERYKLDSSITAKEAFETIRDAMEINESYSVEKTRSIMAVRNELKTMGYMTYMPATVAKDVSDKTVVAIKENSAKYYGVEISSETTRTYPNEKLASHILGYLGSISESEKEEYITKKGYQSTDLIGKEGIEGKYENVLRGTDGSRTVQVDAKGNMTKVIRETAPKKGSDVYLTIDVELQEILENALEKGINCTRYGGHYTDKFGGYSYSKAFSNCKSGAAVAIDVETSEILAMASYPSYDPNLFAEGISSEDWESVQSENPRDPVSAAPLYNIATKSAVQPGSTFKPVTATAALSKGLSPDKVLNDVGRIKIGNQSFGCWLYNEHKRAHGPLDLRRAITVSCNYYFYDVATGKDWANGKKSLGYSLDIEEIMDYANQYGLGEETGIEISETVTPTITAELKRESMKTQLTYFLEANAEQYFKPEVADSSKKLEEMVELLGSWIAENPSRDEVVRRLEGLPVKKKMIEKLADTLKFTYYVQGQWNVGDQFNISIGQGSNAYTPLQMANYLATLGNGGVHNKVTLIDSVEGQEKKKKSESTKVDITEENLEAIINGMKGVCMNEEGSVYSVFQNFKIPCAGKTGTAERQGKINTKSEVEYVKNHLHQISGKVTFKDVKKEMKRIMEKYPDIYGSEDDAVRRAVMNLTGVSSETLDQFKSDYDNFAWLICMAPADDPKIAVAVMLVQGGESMNCGPIAREIIGEYLRTGKSKEKAYSIDAVEK